MTAMHLFLSLIVLAAQLAAVVLTAPLIAGVRDHFAARLTGGGAPSSLLRWRRIVSAWRTPSVDFSDIIPSNPLLVAAAPLACGAAITAACLAPAFSVHLTPAGSADILMIGGLLAAARFLVQLPALNDPAEISGGAMLRLAAGATAAPALLLIVALLFATGVTTDLDAVLAGLREDETAPRGAFLLAGVALLAIGPTWGVSEPLEAQGSERAMLMLASDVLDLTWITLAGDLAWPRALAAPPVSGASVSAQFVWFGDCGLTAAFWLARAAVVACVLASARAIAFGPVATARLRGGLALVLAVLALQLAATPSEPSSETWAAPDAAGSASR
ncbi:hypothetical protein [Acetobacter nitrogenifigens]|uniref:Formate hydrogenlyase subunit 4 n=1 Tax=Acetobacter nitrogenifigens DSM 23921 = NBRC 105050 TaxID=1120919 RepID=A0A511X642_9PROT|nr:hypothetical protein [Acetobacter nitrogenifigens]GEN58409.1 hypothetical protein ANI02nite_02930 [Acetobacter nitrogenifigens DSM 23921 = NBRC 105050]